MALILLCPLGDTINLNLTQPFLSKKEIFEDLDYIRNITISRIFYLYIFITCIYGEIHIYLIFVFVQIYAYIFECI